MKNKTKHLVKKIYLFFKYLYFLKFRSKIVKKGEARSLYKTIFEDFFWLKKGSYLDDCIIENGVFEETGTKIIKKFLKPGDVVFDIGANIGYYSVLFSKLVGVDGSVFAFEPTKCFRQVLENNLLANNISNVKILPFGLSDKSQELNIEIEDCTASLHIPRESGCGVFDNEVISLVTLNSYVVDNKISKIDFIKIDVDGHEPAVLTGGWDVIEKFKPLIFLEISHQHYLEAGTTAWDFYKFIKQNNWHIYDENTLLEYENLNDFLLKCGNFAYSANVLLSSKKL